MLQRFNVSAFPSLSFSLFLSGACVYLTCWLAFLACLNQSWFYDCKRLSKHTHTNYMHTARKTDSHNGRSHTHTHTSPHISLHNDKWAGERIIFVSLYLIISFEFRAQTFSMCLSFGLSFSLFICVCVRWSVAFADLFISLFLWEGGGGNGLVFICMLLPLCVCVSLHVGFSVKMPCN